ncbi:nodulation protein NolF [soil metagenome]
MRAVMRKIREAAGGVALAVLFTAAACSRGGAEPTADNANAAVYVGSENLAVADSGRLETGPLISGSLAAEQQATVRAQVGGAVLAVAVREGDAVRRGQLLARLEQSAMGDTRLSAAAAVASARVALQDATRNADRSRTLSAAGAISQQQLEQSESAVSAARAQLSAAQAQLANANEALGDTRVTAPISGVVSQRAVNPGDVVQPGAALVTIVDPGSMQLEAAVPSEQLGSIRVGAPVDFTVNGYPGRTFSGTVARISPAADPATRQIPLWVSIPNRGGRLVGGLFAEGRISSESQAAVTVPTDAIDPNAISENAATADVTRIRGCRAERGTVRLGLRDPATERVAVLGGLASGDTVLTGPAREVTPGTPVRVGSQPASAPREP